MRITYTVEGLRELLAKARPEIMELPLVQFWEKAAVTVQAEARLRAPVDTGRLAASIISTIDANVLPMYAVIRPTVFYAPFMEFGTGLLNDQGPRPPHRPPGSALNNWAQRHGFPNGYVVARAIARRGGLAPRRYMRDALSNSIGRIQEFVRELGQDIARRWAA